MVYITDDISLFIRDMYNKKSFEEIFDVYDRQIQSLGFQGSLYTYIPTIHLNEDLPIQPSLQISPSYNHSFLQHYSEENFFKNDFTVKAIQNGKKVPIDWWCEEKKGILAKNEKNIITVAKEEYGITNGITIPVMNEARGIAGTSIISDEKPKLYTLLVQERLHKLEIYTHIFHTHIMSSAQKNALFLEPILNSLTDTEKRLMPFIVSGKPMKSVNIKPEITHRYGEKCLNNIRMKFGNITKSKLIYYIGVMHMLDYL